MILFGGIIPAAYVASSGALDAAMGFSRIGHMFLKWVGSGFFLAGASIVVRSYRLIVKEGRGYTLEFFNVNLLPVTKKLVTAGTYSWVRHPMVSGYLLLLLGISFATGSAAGILVVFPLTTILAALYLIFFEERALRGRFKEEFEAYRMNTPFLVPRFRKNAKRAGMRR